MKLLTVAVAVAGLASAGSLNAQTLPARSGIYTGQNTQTTNCSYARTSNSVGDIIYGRTNVATNCNDVYSRDDGAWYQVGRGANNNSIYERRVRTSNGRLVIQRARRNRNGTFTILSSRVANSNDKQWRKEQKAEQKAWKKQEKAEQKAARKGYDYNHR